MQAPRNKSYLRCLCDELNWPRGAQHDAVVAWHYPRSCCCTTGGNAAPNTGKVHKSYAKELVHLRPTVYCEWLKVLSFTSQCSPNAMPHRPTGGNATVLWDYSIITTCTVPPPGNVSQAQVYGRGRSTLNPDSCRERREWLNLALITLRLW